MTSRQITFALLSVFLFTSATISSGAPKRKKGPKKKGPPPVNVAAEKISKAIPKFNPETSKDKAENQLMNLIHLLAASNRDSLSANASLLRTAMDFREDIGEHQRTITMGAVMKAWDTAFAYGAISNHQFYGMAEKGRYAGEELVFENIVPQEILPQCKGYIGNLRIVPISLARKNREAPLDKRDEAYAIGLRQMLHETKSHDAMLSREKSKIRHLALSKAEEEKRWRTQVAAAGEAFRNKPHLRLQAQKMGTPSKLNGNRYKLRVDVTNLSQYPTEVEIESTIVGYTDNQNKLYELRKDRRVLRLRRSEVNTYLIQTPNVKVFAKPLIRFDPGKSQKVIYRGYTIVAKFDGEIVASTGSDARLLKVASGEYMEPKLIAKASRSVFKPASSGNTLDLIRYASPGDLAAGKNGDVISTTSLKAIGLMADESRMYRLDSDGTLWIYESASFLAASEPLGEVFAGAAVHSLFSDGTSYFLHLAESAADYGENDVVQFSSVGDLISGYNGTVVAQGAPGSSSFMADGKSYFKIHHGSVQQVLLGSEVPIDVITNKKPNFKSEGKVFFAERKVSLFSDGTGYYLLMPSPAIK